MIATSKQQRDMRKSCERWCVLPAYTCFWWLGGGDGVVVARCYEDSGLLCFFFHYVRLRDLLGDNGGGGVCTFAATILLSVVATDNYCDTQVLLSVHRTSQAISNKERWVQEPCQGSGYDGRMLLTNDEYGNTISSHSIDR